MLTSVPRFDELMLRELGMVGPQLTLSDWVNRFSFESSRGLRTVGSVALGFGLGVCGLIGIRGMAILPRRDASLLVRGLVSTGDTASEVNRRCPSTDFVRDSL